MNTNYVIVRKRTGKLLSKFSGCFDADHTDCAFLFTEDGARNFIKNHEAENCWEMRKIG